MSNRTSVKIVILSVLFMAYGACDLEDGNSTDLDAFGGVAGADESTSEPSTARVIDEKHVPEEDLLLTDEISDLDPWADGGQRASYCVAYENKSFTGNTQYFYYPRDYNDLHRKPSFGDKISSIKCFGRGVVVHEHAQWTGAQMTIWAGNEISDLHAHGMGDKISSIKWIGEDTYNGYCTLYKDKNYQGQSLHMPRRLDWNDLHRIGMQTLTIPYPPYQIEKHWGDEVSSYICSGASVFLCKHDQWNSCALFSGSDPDLHNDGYGDNISSVGW